MCCSGDAAANSKPFWDSWGAAFNEQSKKLGDGAGAWWQNVSANSKNWKAPKWEMPGGSCYNQFVPILLFAIVACCPDAYSLCSAWKDCLHHPDRMLRNASGLLSLKQVAVEENKTFSLLVAILVARKSASSEIHLFLRSKAPQSAFM